MAKWYGVIGFAKTVETEPGLWVEQINERSYAGDLLSNNRRLQSSDSVNDNINVSNQISIVTDPYADQNFYAIRYVEFRGTKWKVTNAEVQFPRLILSLGGVYNGEQA